MNELELFHLQRREKGLRALLPSDEALAAIRARKDRAEMEDALRTYEACQEAGEMLLAAREEPEEPIPLLPEPASLVGGLRLRGYVSTFGLLKDDLTMPGYWGDVQSAVDAGVLLTWGHRVEDGLGRLETAQEDLNGLYTTSLVYPPTNETQETIRDALVHGLITGMSYHACVRIGLPVRLATLREICVTAYPANPNARILAVERL